MHARERKRGQSLVEFAIILPIFLVLCTGAIDLGRVYFAHVALVGAVEQGVRTAALKPNINDTIVVNTVVNEPSGTLTLVPGNVTVSPPFASRAQGSTITVSAHTDFALESMVMMAIAGRSTINLAATASMVSQ